MHTSHPEHVLSLHHQRGAELRSRACWSRLAASQRDAARAARLEARAQRLVERAARRAMTRPAPVA
ncbi:hypothetical protein [Quadrisphaera setariae]|uniref:Uncharacterized protein n=1 Tax=Quadrisphaera setariae TaxID=2593304 RepID=A0A5C8ZCT3_9ACTN|nr:hypothetical protein [Quadrisphaera setariae]TXR55264.1 hypothetical protein FMM08_15425 [Quadrisphaera setariae]